MGSAVSSCLFSLHDERLRVVLFRYGTLFIFMALGGRREVYSLYDALSFLILPRLSSALVDIFLMSWGLRGAKRYLLALL